jgi:Tfp pilus assembly protein PilO
MTINLIPKKILFPFGLGLIVLLLFIGLVVLPLINKIKIASQEYLSHQETLAQLDQREVSTKELQRNYQIRQDDLAGLAGAFLDQAEIVGLITTLERVAQKTGNIFEIKAVTPASPLEEEESFLSFRISLWGDFDSLLLFLANLENNPYPPYRIIEIDSLMIRRLTEPIRRGDLETILGVKFYLK